MCNYTYDQAIPYWTDPEAYPRIEELNAMWFLAVSSQHALLVLLAINPGSATASSDPAQAAEASNQELQEYCNHLKASVSNEACIVYGSPTKFKLKPSLHHILQQNVQPGRASALLPLQAAWELQLGQSGVASRYLTLGNGLNDGPTTFEVLIGQRAPAAGIRCWSHRGRRMVLRRAIQDHNNPPCVWLHAQGLEDAMEQCWQDLTTEESKVTHLLGPGKRDEQWQQDAARRNSDPRAMQNAQQQVLAWHRDLYQARDMVDNLKHAWCEAARVWLVYISQHLQSLPHSYCGPTVQLEVTDGRDGVIRMVVGLRLTRGLEADMTTENKAHLPVFQLESRVQMPGPSVDHIYQPIL